MDDEIMMYIPNMVLVKRRFGFGVGDGQVNTKAFETIVSRKLGTYAKELVSAASAESPELGLYVPAGYVKKEGVELYKQILSDKNQFLMETKQIPVVGLGINALDNVTVKMVSLLL